MNQLASAVQQISRSFGTVLALPLNVGSVYVLITFDQFSQTEWHYTFVLACLTVSFPAWCLSFFLPGIALASLKRWKDKDRITEETWEELQHKVASGYSGTISGPQPEPQEPTPSRQHAAHRPKK